VRGVEAGENLGAGAELGLADSVDADRPEAHLNLGLLDLRRRQLTEAEREYRTALRLDPNFVPALVNLADLYRAGGRDDEGSELLRRAMAIEPDNADVRYALGLYLVRKHDYPEALDLLRRAHELIPDHALRLCLCRRVEFERCRGRGVGAPGRGAPEASGGSKRLDGARLDRTGQWGFTCGTPPCPRAADPRSRQHAVAGSDRGARKEGEAVGWSGAPLAGTREMFRNHVAAIVARF
jgi:tetratricopeptide (TPR) repeat protein